MHYYQAFLSAIQWIADFAHVTLIVDDFYQPTWGGIIDAVNEFGAEHALHPVWLADYFRVESSGRTQFTSLMLPLRPASATA